MRRFFVICMLCMLGVFLLTGCAQQDAGDDVRDIQFAEEVTGDEKDGTEERTDATTEAPAAELGERDNGAVEASAEPTAKPTQRPLETSDYVYRLHGEWTDDVTLNKYIGGTYFDDKRDAEMIIQHAGYILGSDQTVKLHLYCCLKEDYVDTEHPLNNKRGGVYTVDTGYIYTPDDRNIVFTKTTLGTGEEETFTLAYRWINSYIVETQQEGTDGTVVHYHSFPGVIDYHF